MLLLDTNAVPRADRVEAFRHALTHASVPNHIVHEEPETGIQARMHLWRVGALDLFTSHNTGFTLTRTARHVRQESRPIVAVSLQTRGAPTPRSTVSRGSSPRTASVCSTR